jgi:hypothetical protein
MTGQFDSIFIHADNIYTRSVQLNEIKLNYIKLNPEGMPKAAFNKKVLFISKLNLNLRKKLVKCYTWGTAFYGAENWTLQKAGQKYLGSSKMLYWRRMENISWADRVRNEEAQHRVGEETNTPRKIKAERPTGLVTSCVETAF